MDSQQQFLNQLKNLLDGYDASIYPGDFRGVEIDISGTIIWVPKKIDPESLEETLEDWS